MERWAEILWRLLLGIIFLALSGTGAILAIFFQVHRQAWEWVRDHANPRAFGAGEIIRAFASLMAGLFGTLERGCRWIANWCWGHLFAARRRE